MTNPAKIFYDGPHERLDTTRERNETMKAFLDAMIGTQLDREQEGQNHLRPFSVSTSSYMASGHPWAADNPLKGLEGEV